MNKTNNMFNKVLIFLLTAVLVGAIGYIAYTLIWPQHSTRGLPVYSDNTPPAPTPAENPVVEASVLPDLHTEKYEIGGYGPEEDRLAYESGSMTLSIPRLDYTGAVLSVDIEGKTTEYTSSGISDDYIEAKLMEDMNTLLDNGIVLFNQAQLPGPENSNVSIAGHRDFKGMEFYYIDTLQEGDLITLSYDGNDYIYKYDRTFITNEQDWEPIAVSDKSQLTLQSCDPIFAPNANYDRIFVIAYLVDIVDNS